jgi:hypothetical protein
MKVEIHHRDTEGAQRAHRESYNQLSVPAVVKISFPNTQINIEPIPNFT